MLRKTLPLLTLAAMTLTSAPYARADDQGDQGVAHERALLVGTIILTDDPKAKTLTVSGNASGFQSGQSYVSFGYGTGSQPTGQNACVPPNPNNLSNGQMMLGQWDGNGYTRTLNNTLSGDNYAPLQAYGTVSIRLDINPTSTSTQITPTRFVLQDCAAVNTDGGNQRSNNGN